MSGRPAMIDRSIAGHLERAKARRTSSVRNSEQKRRPRRGV
jgi:hypothetical protein